MQSFKCHKTVQAGKIISINPSAEAFDLLLDSDRVMVPKAYMEKHSPEVGGYFVRYEDGYESYSPAQAFEAGYTALDVSGAQGGQDARPAGGAGVAAAPDRMLQFFQYAHLPEHLQNISRPFCDIAQWVADNLPMNPERTVALRKLLEAKDAGVRTMLYKG